MVVTMVDNRIANFCQHEMAPLFNPVVDGARPLDDLTLETRCHCTCRSHTWRCLSTYHQKVVLPSYRQVASVIRQNYTSLRQRAGLSAERTRLLPQLVADPCWVYSFYPVICDLPSYQEAIDRAATAADRPGYPLLIDLGIAKKEPTWDIVISEDARFYFQLIHSPAVGTRVSIDSFGKHSGLFFKVVRRALDALPTELIIAIFELAYNCKLTPRCLERLS